MGLWPVLYWTGGGCGLYLVFLHHGLATVSKNKRKKEMVDHIDFDIRDVPGWGHVFCSDGCLAHLEIPVQIRTLRLFRNSVGSSVCTLRLWRTWYL